MMTMLNNVKKFLPLSVIPLLIFSFSVLYSCYTMNGSVNEKIIVGILVWICPIFIGAKYWSDVMKNFNKKVE